MMQQHESGVNFQNLIRDLADMYPQGVDEVVAVELVANSLDAKATRIAIDYHPAGNTLVITDNGQGMDAGQFEQYHDFAAGLKTRGDGIGFAGVGAKISFNAADRVVTETRSKDFAGGSDWRFADNGRLIWDEIQPTHLTGNGTRVEVHFRKDFTPAYTDSADLINLLRRNYLPLLGSQFLDLYHRLDLYPRSLRFVVNGQKCQPTDVAADFIREAKREFLPEGGGKALGFGVLGLSETEYPLGADIGGVLLCTHGKVIKSDLFQQYPANYGPRIFGVVEMPGFIDFITTSKTDFNRKGRNRDFERLYAPLRDEFRNWLTSLGIQQAETENTGEVARLERELRRMAEAIPELSEFFGFRNRSPVLQSKVDGETAADPQEGAEVTYPEGEGSRRHNPGPLAPGDDPGTALVENKESGTQRANPITRRRQSGPRIAFESRPDREELAWVDGNTVIINTGHPAYKKADAGATARHIHNIFAIAGAIQKFLVGPENAADPLFVDRMLAAWGGR